MMLHMYTPNQFHYQVHCNLNYLTLCYPNFQLSDLKSTLTTQFKPVILALLLSNLSFTPKRGSDNTGSTHQLPMYTIQFPKYNLDKILQVEVAMAWSRVTL